MQQKPKANTKTNYNKQKLAVMGGKRQTPVRKGNIKLVCQNFNFSHPANDPTQIVCNQPMS